MNKNFKKVVCVFAFSFVLFSSLRASATGVIQDVKNRTDIASGVQYVEIDRFTESGWIDIDILKLDTKNNFSSLTPLIGPDGVSKRATITSMIESNDAIAGINGDFFEVTNLPMALGSLVGDGEVVLTTPEAAFSRNSFYITKDGKAGVGSLSNNIVVTVNGREFSVNALNKLSKPYSSLSILDKNWGDMSAGRGIGANNVEILVANGRVIDKRIGGLPMNILPGTYVLTQVGENLKSINIGDSVSINYGSYDNIKFSIGGGNILVNNGQVTQTGLSKSRAPRTAIGINQECSEILLVTVDGRNNSSIGMGEKELAEFMRSIGAYYALNLDGGGSTTMGIKYSGDSNASVVNSPSDGKQRPVVSGVGIKSNAPIAEPAYIKITPSDKDMFAGFAYDFNLEVFDAYHNKLDINPSEINVSSDFGTISGNTFTPNKKGNGSINASYKNATGSVELDLHSNIQEVNLDVDSLQMSPGKVHIFETIYGKDDMGYRKKMNASLFTFTTSEGIGSLEGNKFTAGEGPTTGTITANYNGIVRIIPVSVGSEKKEVFSFNSKETLTTSIIPNDDTKITAQATINEEGQDGNPSTELIYSLAAYDKDQVAELNYAGGIDLGKAQHIGLWIKGDNQAGKVTATFRDGNGKTGVTTLANTIDWDDWKYVEAQVPDSLTGNIYLDKLSLIISEEKELISSIKFDGLVSYVKLPINWELAKGSNIAADNKNYGVTDEAATKYSITSLNKAGDNSGKINHLQNKNVAVIFNGASAETLNQINAGMKFNGNDVHNIKTAQNTSFITLQSNKNGIRSANPNQWKSFIAAMENPEYNNFVIMMENDPNNMVGEKEKTFFFDLIDKGVKSGKSIFIVLPGNRDSIEYIDGYRKVTLSGSDNGVLDINILNGNLSYVLTRIE